MTLLRGLFSFNSIYIQIHIGYQSKLWSFLPSSSSACLTYSWSCKAGIWVHFGELLGDRTNTLSWVVVVANESVAEAEIQPRAWLLVELVII